MRQGKLRGRKRVSHELELAEGKWGGEGNSPVDPVRL